MHVVKRRAVAVAVKNDLMMLIIGCELPVVYLRLKSRVNRIQIRHKRHGPVQHSTAQQSTDQNRDAGC